MGDAKAARDNEQELSELFDEITFSQDASMKSKFWNAISENLFVVAGMGATVFYFTKGAKLLGREHHAFNTALMKRTAAQAVTVGFIIIGALNHKRKSYDEQVKHDIITEININEDVSK